jgi:hypothetical protein
MLDELSPLVGGEGRARWPGVGLAEPAAERLVRDAEIGAVRRIDCPELRARTTASALNSSV